ncbi:hypothetical protein [Arthrobacter sp. ov118]|uniref:hypothetical protein n=1 Tax=Arthrobacter sp. ov118 TaxID=1761747 RepID=UPI0008DFF628|nr:hypothetical protein [Arthrobacter sp. ov118]SFT80389.1 hypothetical protein SAMN04487915_103331 [Arthrobacter sp. ov118]
MTENEVPQHGPHGTAANQDAGQTPLRPASTFPREADGEIYSTPAGDATTASVTAPPLTSPAGTSTTGTSTTGASAAETARQEAAEVSRTAADSAQTVAGTVQTEAANVAAEVKTNARDLLYQAKSGLTEQAGTQQQKAAEGLRSISSQLHSMASASDQPGVASDLVRQAAERSSAVAGWLDRRNPDSLLDEVKSFARQRPGTFLLLAAGAGVLAGRLSRSLSAGAPPAASRGTVARPGAYPAPIHRIPDTGAAVPPPQVQLPGPEVTTAGLTGTYPPNPLADEGTESDSWPADPTLAEPYRNAQ